MIDTLIVLAKEPLPGFAKTRLTPPLTPTEAASIAAACLQDTLDAVSRTAARRHLLAFAGDAAGWAPTGWDVVQQPAGSLDERISAAFDAAGVGSALLVGMDTPQLQPHHLLHFAPARCEAALGLAPDGGYWALGLRDARRAREVVLGVPMSTPSTGAHQYARLQAAGIDVTLLEPLADVDTVDDLSTVLAGSPLGRFRQVVTALQPRLVGRAG
ncbi:DUF2064 domain-containing protein [uncultured Jatrophihabitans sp.]|uniref:TIGR04282 family arsenosugar biosynthesis glycosyltransferase n=1 Tax=uncultured Jatrophihabitans sp. TaxID=1610747 RepID=UPI0035CBB763